MTVLSTDDFPPDQYFRTNDMTVVACLSLEGHSAQGMYDESGTVYWAFIKVGALVDLVQKFHAGELRVDPKEFSRTQKEARRQLHQLMDRRQAARLAQ